DAERGAVERVVRDSAGFAVARAGLATTARSQVTTASTAHGMTVPRRGWTAYLALGVGGVGIEWSALFVRWAGVSGPASAFYRALVAPIVIAPAWLWRGRRRSLAARPAVLGVLAGV